MRYAFLIYGDQSDWAELSEQEAAEARAKEMPKWEALFGELARVDPKVDGTELDEATLAKTLTVSNGQTLVTDGPFAETKELIGGIFVIDCPNLDVAIELAARIPTAEHGSIEVRPLVER